MADDNKSAVADEVAPELNDLLNQGKFAEYHIQRARNFMALGNYKEAVQQLGASLSHDPRNKEALTLRSEAKQKLRSK